MNTSYTGARASAQDSASSKRDNFTSDQFDWLRQVANDGGLSSTASRVAIALTKYFNREYEGWAWMAQATLARDLGITERAVRSALADLVQRGHLVTKRRGKRATNLYRLALNSESDRREFSDHDRKKNSGHDRKEFSDHPTVTGTIPRSDRNESSGVTGTNLPPNPLNEPIEGRESPQPGLGGWAAYF
jgi:hypothetical protein